MTDLCSRALYQSSAEQTQVADVAADWGFWHLSQFSKDYRQLFGERPSDTLQKIPWKNKPPSQPDRMIL
nr:helix-turn-helix domain-containing protein [Oleiphilus messinensis]